jgi:hypothetical protein
MTFGTVNIFGVKRFMDSDRTWFIMRHRHLYHTDAFLLSPEGFLLILYKGRVLQGEDIAPGAR